MATPTYAVATGAHSTPWPFPEQSTHLGDPMGAASATNGICLHHRLGVPAVLQQITLATQINQTLELIRSHGRGLI